MTPLSSLSPESRLVFLSADPSCDAAVLAAVADEVRDWGRAIALAEREVATSSLWRALRDTSSALPEPVTAHLRRSAIVSDFRMQQLSLRLQRTVAAFTTEGIPLLLLKGAAIGALFDPSFRLRPMTDIDALVRREDVGRARAALVAAGWTESTDPELREVLEDHHHLPPFLDPQMPGVRFELHVSLFPSDHSFTVDESHFLRDAQPAAAPFAGTLVPTLDHLLLHACVHFAWQHTMEFAAWRTLRAVGLVVRSPDFSWERFVETALTAKAATSCYWTLRLAQRLSGIEIPTAALARLQPPTAESVRAALERHFIAALVPGEGVASPSIRLSRLLWRTALRPRWSGHRTPERWDPEGRWERWHGLAPESLRDRLRRHAADYRAWWTFFAHTLLG